MDPSFLLGLAANVAVVLTALGAFLWFSWGRIKSTMEDTAISIVRAEVSTINRHIESVRQSHDAMWKEIEAVKRFDVKLGVMEERVANVQTDVSEIKADVKSLDSTITNAILRVARESK